MMSLKEEELVNKMLINKVSILVIINVTGMSKETIEDMKNELIKDGRLNDVP